MWKYLLVCQLFWGTIANAANLLLIDQEFVKFGKKEVYETEKKSWLEQFSKLTAKQQPSPFIAIYDQNSSQYLYLTQMSSYGEIDTYFQKQRMFKVSKSFPSTLNFRIMTVHEEIPRCSTTTENLQATFFSMPHVRYHVYGVAPGQGEAFERYLEKMVKNQNKVEAPATWRTWKVIFGSDTPKYVVCLFAKDKQELEKQGDNLVFVDPAMREILRRDRAGDVEVRRDLSFVK